MKVRILGCGGSFGSPLAWEKNGKIDINNKRNFRTRSSVLIKIKDTNILIDCSPDLRQQLYNAKCTKIDTVLFTHIHSDHVAGLPDIRAISLINDKIIPAYMPPEMEKQILNNYKFIFEGDKDYQPFMSLHLLENKFKINDIDKLKNLDLWIVGLLKCEPHPSHAGFSDIIEYINYLKPKSVVFTHMTALIDEKEILNKIPSHINAKPGWDGLEIELK